MAMMNLCSDSREQSDSKMDECRQVADRIREAGRCDRQEIDKLGSSKRISNDALAYPISRSDDTPSSRSRSALPEQDLDSTSLEASIPPSGGARSRDKNLVDRTPAPSVTPEEQTKHSKRRGEVRSNQTCSDGRTDNSNSQRLLLSEAPEEGKAQHDRRLTERPESKNHPLQVLQNPSPLLSCSETLSNVIRKSAGSTTLSAKAPEALGARNTRKKQAAPPVRKLPHPSLNALPGSGSGISSPTGEDTQGPSRVDYTLEIEAVFPLDMVLDM